MRFDAYVSSSFHPPSQQITKQCQLGENSQNWCRKERRSRLRLTLVSLVSALALLLAAACGSTGDQSAQTNDDLTRVSFALDWAPNTNHVGVYVAQELGYFQEAGLEVTILPYGSTTVAQLVSAGQADFGIAGQSNVQMARTSGLDVVSVYSVTQTDAGRLVVLADRDDLQRPADLDGATFGGFGAPLYTALARATITGDGGQGQFTEVALDTGAYEALASGRIDFTLSVATWENIQAELDGRPYREFRYQDYGLPDQQATGIISSDAYLADQPEAAKAFVGAVARGYRYAAENPDEAAKILVGSNPDTLGAAAELVHRSMEVLAGEGYLVSSQRPIGQAAAHMWAEFGEFLFDGGFLIDSSGQEVTDEPDWSQYYTNDYL